MKPGPGPAPRGTPVDAHVHVYGCFDPGRFLDAAAASFRRHVPGREAEGTAGVLLLTEAAGVDFFATLRSGAGAVGLGGWRVRPTGDPAAVEVARDGERLIVCAGRQIATRERLEVLALLTDASFDDGGELRETMARVRDAGGVPVIPWGFGKWLGRRAEILAGAMEAWRARGERVLLGDNGNRLRRGGGPAPFEEVRREGGLVVPGSDPLPFRSHERRGGTYGFIGPVDLDPDRPASSLRDYLRSADGPLEVFGRRVGPARFVTDQVVLQVRQRLVRARRSRTASAAPQRAPGPGS